MNRFWLALFFIFGAHPAAWTEELKPPVPMNAEEGLDILPPPLDLDQLTPVMLPSAPATGLTPQAAAILKSLDSAEPTPTKSPEKSPSPAPTRAATPLPATATPTVEVKKAEAPTPSLGAFADYFPTAKGAQWIYEYLKPAPGETAKKSRVVECLAREISPSGGVNVTFQVTEDGKTLLEKYSLSTDKIAHTSSSAQTLADDFVFQFPAKGAVARWMGGGNYFKAAFGSALVYQKTYPDCVIVTEKRKSSTVISYYAKAIGLVAVEVYGKGLKLDQSKSTALVSGPAAGEK